MAFISKVFHLLAPPVFKDDEEKSRIARTLNFILIAVLILLLSFSIPLFLTSEPARIFVEVVLTFWTLGMLVLLRRGYVRQAAFLMSLTLWVVVSYGTYQAGGFRGSIMSSYYGIVLIACLVLGTRTGAVFAVLSILFTGWLVYADMTGLLPIKAGSADLPIFWGEFSAVMIFVIVALALITNDLRKALEVTRLNAKELHSAAIKAQVLANKAEQANNFKSSLIHRISHELRTPVSIILPLSEMLGESHYGELTDSQAGIVKRIFSNSIKLEKLIKELLDQSQIESGHLKLNLASFSPAEMAHELYLDCLTLAEKQGIGLNIEIGDHLPKTIMGDLERTEEILRNLVVNAIKYTEMGGVVIRVNHVDSEHWGFQVEDTGVGISKEAQQYIFDAFRQVDETVTQRRGGIGLGLSIVQYLVVEAMGGTIDLVSELGIGSTFTVVLPINIPNSDDVL
jgi:signal transduction histidine kinase